MGEQSEINKIIAECESGMQKAIESLKKEFAKIHSGRASTSMLDNIRIDYYGNLTPLNQLGNISASDPQLITISAWEKKMLPEIEKAILKANLGFTPQNDGNIVRIPIPPLTSEKRKETAKIVKKVSEEYKNSVRILRREANQNLKNLEKQKEFSEDEINKAIADVQKITSKNIEEIDSINKDKTLEVTTI